MGEFAEWAAEFEARARRRAATRDPDWEHGARLHPAIVRSIQRFQIGESGDGANLIAKAEAAGPGAYPAAVRWFVAEESDHARLLALLLTAAGAPTIRSHWSDTVFVRARRMLGVRLELMVLMIAEVVALGYYRALRDGAGDALTAEVAARILADERVHVPFHCERLRDGFAGVSPGPRRLVAGVWRGMFAGALLAVAVDHGPALRRLGVSRTRFAAEVYGLFDAAVTSAMTSVSPPPTLKRSPNARGGKRHGRQRDHRPEPAPRHHPQRPTAGADLSRQPEGADHGRSRG